MNDQELQLIEAHLRQWKPKDPSPQLTQQVFRRPQEAEPIPRAGKLAWLPPACTLGTAIASVALLAWKPILPTADGAADETAALATTQLTVNALLKLPGGTFVNNWHTVTFASTNY